jgi:hypothetical protein
MMPRAHQAWPFPGDVGSKKKVTPTDIFLYSDQPLAEYFKEYRRYHGLVPRQEESYATMVSAPTRKAGYEEETNPDTSVLVGPAEIRCVRTLRVPDDGREYPLPPVSTSFYALCRN